jgi:hypothetical protein
LKTNELSILEQNTTCLTAPDDGVNHDPHAADPAPGDMELAPAAPGNGVSLFFRPGERPTAAAIAALLDASNGEIMARVTHRPADDEGWLELLASGLTFELTGLEPADAAAGGDTVQIHGFDRAPLMTELEAIHLLPGRHIAGGAGLPPVIRTQAGLAASLALKLPVAAVGWQSAQTVMEPRYFAQIVVNWLAGGTFPALGLTALLRGEDGSIATRGLSRFSGCEMQLEGAAGEPPSETLKLAIRIVDYLVRQGSITEPREIDTPKGRLLLEPSRAGRQLWVWRQA